MLQNSYLFYTWMYIGFGFLWNYHENKIGAIVNLIASIIFFGLYFYIKNDSFLKDI